jgi:L-asparaginase
MLPPTETGYDGTRNLRDAILVAASKRGHPGGLVALNGEMHLAADVMKMHPTALNAFESPRLGPIGHVVDRLVRLPHELSNPPRFGDPEVTSESLARVHVELVPGYAGLSSRTITAILSSEPDGAIITLLGGGVVPGDPSVLETLVRKATTELILVGALRSPAGYPIWGRTWRGGPEYAGALSHRGIIVTWLSPIKARLALLLELAGGDRAEAVRQRLARRIGAFNSDGSPNDHSCHV